MTLRFLLDEDIAPAVAAGLRARGHEVGRGNQGIADDEQLQLAVEQGRVLVTYNRGDFHVLNASWHSEERPHSGILWCTDGIIKRPGIGELIRALSAMSEVFDDLTGLCLPLQRAT